MCVAQRLLAGEFAKDGDRSSWLALWTHWPRFAMRALRSNRAFWPFHAIRPHLSCLARVTLRSNRAFRSALSLLAFRSALSWWSLYAANINPFLAIPNPQIRAD
jgi:hypothetical protein